MLLDLSKLQERHVLYSPCTPTPCRAYTSGILGYTCCLTSTTFHGLTHLSCLPGPAAPGLFFYTSNTTKNTYVLNTNFTSQKDAQTMCNSLGGHLVAWTGYAEQLEVEQYYIKQVGGCRQCLRCHTSCRLVSLR
jgi:hypothetical protein